MLPPKYPTVLSRDEVKLLFSYIDPDYKCAALLFYGSEIRRSQCLRLRVNDVDLSKQRIRVWSKSELRHKFTTISPVLLPCIEHQVARVESYLLEDLSMLQSPHPLQTSRLEKKYKKANLELGWHYLFPSKLNTVKSSSGDNIKRHHIDEKSFNLAIADAINKAGINKLLSSQSLRHSFSELLQNSHDAHCINEHITQCLTPEAQ